MLLIIFCLYLYGFRTLILTRVSQILKKSFVSNMVVNCYNKFAEYLISKAADVKKRRVTISNLPPEATFSDIFSIVWGGKVESVEWLPETTHASVLFTSSEDCARYLNSTRGDILNAFDEDNQIIHVEIGASSDPEVFSSIHHGSNKSRCIKITGSLISWKDAGEIDTLAINHDCNVEFLELKKKRKVCFSRTNA